MRSRVWAGPRASALPRRSSTGSGWQAGPDPDRPSAYEARMIRPLAGQRPGGQQDNEARLIARAKAGDAAACERLSGAYADRLLMLLLRLVADRREAESVAQDAQLRAGR